MTTTPKAVDALAEAIQLLKYVSGGRQYSADELREPLARFEAALTDGRMLDIQDARRREQSRELSRTRKGLDLRNDTGHAS